MARLITLQLKRYKLLSVLIFIPFIVVIVPLAIFIKLGDIAEFILDKVVNTMDYIREFLVKVLRFDEVAMKQEESGKFDKKYGKERMYK